jgi:hypothetical protein
MVSASIKIILLACQAVESAGNSPDCSQGTLVKVLALHSHRQCYLRGADRPFNLSATSDHIAWYSGSDEVGAIFQQNSILGVVMTLKEGNIPAFYLRAPPCCCAVLLAALEGFHQKRKLVYLTQEMRQIKANPMSQIHRLPSLPEMQAVGMPTYFGSSLPPVPALVVS